MDAMYRCHRLAAAITDLDALLEQILEESKALGDAEACSLLLYDNDSEELYFHVALGEQGDQQALKRDIRLQLGQGIAGEAGAQRTTINVPDVQQDARFYGVADQATRFETRSVLATPMVDRESLIGVLELVNKIDGAGFTQTDVHVMEIFSSLVATSIANARLIEDNMRAERMAAIGQAMAGLSHYIKNIITGMTGSVDLIDEGLQKNDSKLLHSAWPIFRRSTRRIALFADDMLSYSKAREPMREHCDLEELVQEVSDTFWGLLVRKRIDLSVDLSRINNQVNVDARALFRCLLNLMTNAADACPKEGGRIEVSAYPMEERGLVIEVADNGPGIPMDQRSRIFEPFYSTKGSQGTGIGLAVTRKIVAEHGGKLEIVESPLGGALFRIVLPESLEMDTEH
jgi:signal transduction histidine kinase